MYGKILVPLDGSMLSEGVLPYVRTLARGMSLPIELLRVRDPLSGTPDAPFGQGGEYLVELASSLAGFADVKCRTEVGDPARTIVDLAGAQPNNLIAMATHGTSGIQRWLLGSVAEKVWHAATNDLLLVRPGDGDTRSEARLNTVLVPLDGSELAEKVLPTVARLAATLSLTVVLVRVVLRVNIGVPDAYLPLFGMNPPMQNQIWAQESLAASRYLNEKEEQLRAAGLAGVSSSLIEGHAGGAAAEIIDLAQETPNELVAMSTHGQSGLGRWLIGSVTERVVRHSNRPVLVIRSRS
jgi:nucleotide-binding universal stress UspA family protein